MAEQLRNRGPFAAVIHAAVQPHRFADSLLRRRETSPDLAGGLLAAMRKAFGVEGIREVHGLLLSTVSVYGEADREGVIGPQAEQRPPSAYGRGKQAAEQRWSNAEWARTTILRVGPVYEPGRLRNAIVRTRIPGLPVRLHLRPEPKFSLCAMETLVARVVERLEEGQAGPSGAENVVDREVWTASAVDAAFGIGGPRLVVPAALPRSLLRMLRAIPGTYGLRCLLAKRVGDIVYR